MAFRKALYSSKLRGQVVFQDLKHAYEQTSVVDPEREKLRVVGLAR